MINPAVFTTTFLAAAVEIAEMVIVVGSVAVSLARHSPVPLMIVL